MDLWFDSRQVQRFYFLQNIQTFSRAHPGSYFKGAADTASWAKLPFGGTKHAPLSCVKVKNASRYLIVCTWTSFF